MILIQSFDENNWMIEQNFAGTIIAVKIKHRCFSGRIISCHATDPGSIPGRCKAGEPKTLPEKRKLKFFVFFTVPLSKKRKLPKYSGEFKTWFRFPSDANQKSRKILPEKRKLKFLQLFTVPLSKKKTTEIFSWIQPQLEWNKFLMILFKVLRKKLDWRAKLCWND